MKTIIYEEEAGACKWNGIALQEGKDLSNFLADEVAERLHDASGIADFTAHLEGLTTTGFGFSGLAELLSAANDEERSWAVGEALAEAWLSLDHGVIWPWNMAVDKRTPNASLPGPDLVGFLRSDGRVRLVLGEVKSSSDAETPPGVMTGRKGMTRQLETLAEDKSLLWTLLRWLQPRCRDGEYRALFDEAVRALLGSSNVDIALFGVLVRDTQPNVMDLRSRGGRLAGLIVSPGDCRLVALYLPYPLADLSRHCPLKAVA